MCSALAKWNYETTFHVANLLFILNLSIQFPVTQSHYKERTDSLPNSSYACPFQRWNQLSRKSCNHPELQSKFPPLLQFHRHSSYHCCLKVWSALTNLLLVHMFLCSSLCTVSSVSKMRVICYLWWGLYWMTWWSPFSRNKCQIQEFPRYKASSPSWKSVGYLGLMFPGCI